MTEEQQLVHAFFRPERRERYMEFVGSPKHRRKLISELAHSKAVDERWKLSIPSQFQSAEDIAKMLVDYGASTTCLVLSDHKEIDGTRMLLNQALDTVLGRTFGTFLSCQPGSLAYFENEDGRWILKRT